MVVRLFFRARNSENEWGCNTLSIFVFEESVRESSAFGEKKGINTIELKRSFLNTRSDSGATEKNSTRVKLLEPFDVERESRRQRRDLGDVTLAVPDNVHSETPPLSQLISRFFSLDGIRRRERSRSHSLKLLRFPGNCENLHSGTVTQQDMWGNKFTAHDRRPSAHHHLLITQFLCGETVRFDSEGICFVLKPRSLIELDRHKVDVVFREVYFHRIDHSIRVRVPRFHVNHLGDLVLVIDHRAAGKRFLDSFGETEERKEVRSDHT